MGNKNISPEEVKEFDEQAGMGELPDGVLNEIMKQRDEVESNG